MTDPAIVYYSTTSDRFHGVPDCPAYEMGRAIWNTEPVFVERTVAAAMGSGKLPCTRCLPGLLAAWYRSSCEEDFGHEPMDIYTNGKLRTVECFRCRVLWPCTSAVVLGLVPRGER